MRGLVTKHEWFIALAVVLSTAGCGNGGSINFQPGAITSPSVNNRGVGTTLVPAGQALVIESGKTTTNGYHAKLQLNPIKGTKLTAGSYELQMKHTVRNR